MTLPKKKHFYLFIYFFLFCRAENSLSDFAIKNDVFAIKLWDLKQNKKKTNCLKIVKL